MALVVLVLQDEPIEEGKVRLKHSIMAHPPMTNENMESSPAIAAGVTAYLAIREIMGNMEGVDVAE